MRICIAGWYFNKELLDLMEKVNKEHKVDIVAHREGDPGNLDMVVINNIGLEFHCYNHYINNLWDGESNVLFMHDDIVVSPVIVNYEIIPPTNIFNKIDKLEVDQAYIFHDEDDAEWNALRHGRIILMSARLIKYLKNNRGLWFDPDNHGDIWDGNGNYNNGILMFDTIMNYLKDHFNVKNVALCPSIVPLRRNGLVDQSKDAIVEENKNERNHQADGIL